MRLPIYEMGISYHGRTYEEGKKIGIRDGLHAVYCILRYDAHSAPVPIQFLLYLLIGGTAAIMNMLLFLSLLSAKVPLGIAAPAAFVTAASLNYVAACEQLVLVGLGSRDRGAALGVVAVDGLRPSRTAP